jgi:hypothetical protein
MVLVKSGTLLEDNMKLVLFAKDKDTYGRSKMAKWPIADRARDLEQAKGYQRELAKQLDTRKQTEPKPTTK